MKIINEILSSENKKKIILKDFGCYHGILHSLLMTTGVRLNSLYRKEFSSQKGFKDDKEIKNDTIVTKDTWDIKDLVYDQCCSKC